MRVFLSVKLEELGWGNGEKNAEFEFNIAELWGEILRKRQDCFVILCAKFYAAEFYFTFPLLKIN